MATCRKTPNTTPRANASPSSKAASPSWRRSSPPPRSSTRQPCPATRSSSARMSSWSTRRPRRRSTYQIVGVHEADIKQSRLSISSPLAKALIGKNVGDTVSVPAPGGDRSYEILQNHLRLRTDDHARRRRRPRRGADRGRVLRIARSCARDARLARHRRRGLPEAATICRPPAPSRSAARPTGWRC